jgi:hypothetical protein
MRPSSIGSGLQPDGHQHPTDRDDAYDNVIVMKARPRPPVNFPWVVAVITGRSL